MHAQYSTISASFAVAGIIISFLLITLFIELVVLMFSFHACLERLETRAEDQREHYS